MKSLIIIFFCLFIIISKVKGQDEFERYRKFGTVFISSLQNSAFPCDDRLDGLQVGDKTYTYEENYSDSSVIVFLPNKLNSSQKINMVFFFYGWLNSNYYSATKTDLIQQFINSKRNAIIVFPAMAKFAPDSFEGNFKNPNCFENYIVELIDTLFTNKLINSKFPGNIILCGHSGGNRPILSAIKYGGMQNFITEVYLLDALYNEPAFFAGWIKDFNGKIINVFTDKGGTYKNSLALMKIFDEESIFYQYAEEDEYAFTAIPSFTSLILHTKVDHGAVVEKNLYRYLSMSYLDLLPD
jgi:hypothetical protein